MKTHNLKRKSKPTKSPHKRTKKSKKWKKLTIPHSLMMKRRRRMSSNQIVILKEIYLGGETSQHSSIDLEAYLKRRNEFPDEVDDDDEDDEEELDDEEDEDDEDEEMEEEAPKKKETKKDVKPSQKKE